MSDHAKRRLLMTLLATAGLSLTLSTGASAQAPDTRPIRLIVPYPAGGPADIVARAIAQPLSEELGRSVVIDNRPGASGMIGATAVAKAAPDGTTLLFTPSTHATNPALYPSLQYDTRRDFRAAGIVASTPYVLVVHPSVPATDVPSLLSHLRAHPQQAFFATASAGSSQHISVALLSQLTGIDHLQYVHYKGSAAALPDVLSGRVPMMFDNIALMLPYLKDGRLRAIAVTSPTRSALLPEVPTMAESGFPAFDVTGWFGILAPTGTPDRVIDEVAKALALARQTPEFATKVREIGAQLVDLDAAGSERFVQNETTRMQQIIEKAGIKLE